MFDQEFNCQKIFKRESSKIDNTYFFPSKNQERSSCSSLLSLVHGLNNPTCSISVLYGNDTIYRKNVDDKAAPKNTSLSLK